MKPSLTALLLLSLISCASFSQEVGPLPVRYASASVTPVQSDKLAVSEATVFARRIESSLQDYLVAFDSRHDSNRKRVGLPLAAFAERLFSVAYDISGRNLMAQWKISQSSAYGNIINYHAYLGESGMVSFAISSNF